MKQIACLFVSLALLVSCTNDPQKQAEKAVTSFLKKNQQMYEPISFGTVDTLDLSRETTYLTAKDSLHFYKNALKETGDQFKLAASQQGAKRQQQIIADMEQFYSGKRYRINHKYKVNNGNNTEERENDFYLSATFEVME